MQEPQNKHEHHYSWDETLRTIIGALVLAMLFRSFLFEPFHIPSGSMKSNLLVGDYLFVSKYSYGYSRYSFPFGLPAFKGRILELSEPQRGDVVVFRLPRNPRIDYIKRIIGLPGDHIQVRKGIVYINGEPLKREKIDEYPYSDDENPLFVRPVDRLAETLPEGKAITILKDPANSGGFADNTPIYIVPEGYYFAMGDNRDHSRDSRFTDEVGFVPAENLVGKAQIIFLSTSGSFFNPLDWRYDRFFTLVR